MAALIAGVDYSSKAVDIVLLDEDTDAATWHRFELAGQDAFDRARSVRAAMLPFNNLWDGVLAVGIEDPRGYNAGALYRVQGAILGRIPSELLVQPWIPSQWRKALGMKGNATKAEVFAWTAQHYLQPWHDNDDKACPQDAVDALCVALATRSLLEIGEAA